MMHKEKYEVTPQNRSTITERISSFYGNIRSMLLGGVLSGRRSTYEVDEEFPEDTQLMSYKQEVEGKEEVQLKPKHLDLHRTLNRNAHHTSAYEIPNLILRRGFAFDMCVSFDRTFVEETDEIILKFVTGRKPLQSKGTVVPVHCVRNLKPSEWGYQITGVEDKKVNIKVSTSALAIVGRYQLFVDTIHKTNDGTVEKCRFCHPDDIFIIFNPWCQDDAVYLAEEPDREEYILNETGRIWMGTVGRFNVRPWNFAQFDDVCLMAALSMMEKSELGDPARGNPLLVVRALSRTINNNERDGGVLIGNWSGKYEDGVAPYSWNGSSAILEEFLKKRKGVKYGQCWTFAAIATTVFRALGIPTRCVTNFKSAHDSDFSIQLDNFWTPEGKPRKQMNDTVWDFHVWNESWFRRPDLPEGYDGWQAYDPTPQECYEGVFTCGPVSVKALRQAELYLGFDAKFMYAEMNGGLIHWIVDTEGNMTPIGEEKDIVGHFMSTKAVGTISREDVTSLYKNTDISSEAAKTLVSGYCSKQSVFVQAPKASDVDFNLLGNVQKTGDIDIAIKIRNNSSESRIVDLYMCAVSAKYTAVATTELKESSATNVLEPNAESDLTMNLKAADFLSSIDPDSHVSVFCSAHVKETGQRFVRREIYRAELPNLELKTDGSTTVGKPFDVIVKLVNPLSVPLTGGYICMEAPGMIRPSTIKIKKPIAPNEELRETIQMKPRRAGRREVIACFQCKQICNVTGVVDVEVISENKT